MKFWKRHQNGLVVLCLVHGAANVSSVNNKQRGTINTHLQGTTKKKGETFFFSRTYGLLLCESHLRHLCAMIKLATKSIPMWTFCLLAKRCHSSRPWTTRSMHILKDDTLHSTPFGHALPSRADQEHDASPPSPFRRVSLSAASPLRKGAVLYSRITEQGASDRSRHGKKKLRTIERALA